MPCLFYGHEISYCLQHKPTLWLVDRHRCILDAMLARYSHSGETCFFLKISYPQKTPTCKSKNGGLRFDVFSLYKETCFFRETNPLGFFLEVFLQKTHRNPGGSESEGRVREMSQTVKDGGDETAKKKTTPKTMR